MSTYPIEIDLTPHDPPALRLRVVIGALAAAVALLLVLAIAHSTVGTVGDGLERGQEFVKTGGATKGRIAELDARYDGAGPDQ